MDGNDNNTLYVVIDEKHCVLGNSYGGKFFLSSQNKDRVLLFQGNKYGRDKQLNALVNFNDQDIQDKIKQANHNNTYETIKIFDISHASTPELKNMLANKQDLKHNFHAETKHRTCITKEDIKNKNITGWINQEHPIENRVKIISQLLNRYTNDKNIEIHSTACFGSYRQKTTNGTEINYVTELQNILKKHNSNARIILKLSPIQDETTSIDVVGEKRSDQSIIYQPYIIYGLNMMYKQDDFPYLIQPDVHILKDDIDIKYNQFMKDEYYSSYIAMGDNVHYFCDYKPNKKDYKPNAIDKGLYLKNDWIFSKFKKGSTIAKINNDKAINIHIDNYENNVRKNICPCNCF